MRFVVVTGMSGGGKGAALKILEDAGFYCVDNLPVALIPKLFELLLLPNSELNKVALGIDIRSAQSSVIVEETLEAIKKQKIAFEILFMEAEDSVLIKRYKETRRVQPLSAGGNLVEGIAKEREIISILKEKADYVIDTSHLLIRELKEELDKIFINNKEYNSLIINIISFGYKYGIPVEADLVFDVRFLPNPFYLEELKQKTGNDKEVQDYVLKFEETKIFLEKLTDFIEFLIPNYVKEGKYQLVIAIGCTGGQHRSVTLANSLYERLTDKGNYGLIIKHRDLQRRR